MSTSYTNGRGYGTFANKAKRSGGQHSVEWIILKKINYVMLCALMNCITQNPVCQVRGYRESLNNVNVCKAGQING